MNTCLLLHDCFGLFQLGNDGLGADLQRLPQLLLGQVPLFSILGNLFADQLRVHMPSSLSIDT